MPRSRAAAHQFRRHLLQPVLPTMPFHTPGTIPDHPAYDWKISKKWKKIDHYDASSRAGGAEIRAASAPVRTGFAAAGTADSALPHSRSLSRPSRGELDNFGKIEKMPSRGVEKKISKIHFVMDNGQIGTITRAYEASLLYLNRINSPVPLFALSTNEIFP